MDGRIVKGKKLGKNTKREIGMGKKEEKLKEEKEGAPN